MILEIRIFDLIYVYYNFQELLFGFIQVSSDIYVLRVCVGAGRGGAGYHIAEYINTFFSCSSINY